MAHLTETAVQRFRDRGLRVVELAGWQDRGETDGPFDVLGILLHHDGVALGFNDNPNDDDNVPHFMAQNGQDGAQLWIKRDGSVFILAAGRKFHAGSGQGFRGIPANKGNSTCIGIETDHTDGVPWTDALLGAILTVSQELCAEYDIDPMQMCAGHKEYAPDRKHDPENFDLDQWRRNIRDHVHAGPARTTTFVGTLLGRST
jgi:N-acetyl-anhydromuramyl-L-alanine amidase AmpD